MSLTLDRAELNELVGLVPRTRSTLMEVQQRLGEQGIPFRVVGCRILVSRAMAESWLAGRETPRPSGGVRLDLVR